MIPRFVLVLVLTVFVSPVLATTLAPLSDQNLTERAEVIVIGRAIARQAVWVERDLVTLVTVAISESLKGPDATTITVALPGGIDRRRKIPVEVLYVGAPHIATGEEVLLFLERTHPQFPDAHVVSGFSQGKFSIVSDAAGLKWVSRGRLHDTRSARRLSDVRGEIRRHLDGGHP